MKSSDSASRVSITQLGWKAFWLAMLLMHVPPILAVFNGLSAGLTDADWSSGNWIRLIGLFGSAGFFFLKMVNVAWLRISPTWRARVAAMAIVALLHAGVLERSGVVDATSTSAKIGFVVLLAVSVNVESVRSLLVRFAKLRTMACQAFSINSLHTHTGRVYETPFLPYESLFSYRSTAPRGPPLS